MSKAAHCNAKHFLIHSRSYVIWMGDLNFRIDDLAGEEIKEMATSLYTNPLHRKLAIAKMQSHDQLMKVQESGRAFSEFEETRPTFMPTYKYFVNSNQYNLHRKPAWTDRILYRVTKNAYDNLTLSIHQEYYSCHDNYLDSDHKPVSSLFRIKVFNRQTFEVLDMEEPTRVSFLPITTTTWFEYENFDVWFTITSRPKSGYWDAKNVPFSDQDWVGLYPANFTSIDEHIIYTWVNPFPQTDVPPRVRQKTDELAGQHKDCNVPPDVDCVEAVEDTQPMCSNPIHYSKPLWFKITFTEPAYIPANVYRLVYVSHNFSNILGLSAPFEIKYANAP